MLDAGFMLFDENSVKNIMDKVNTLAQNRILQCIGESKRGILHFLDI